MRVVVAPDSFKGSVAAATAASAISRGWSAVRPGDDVLEVPLADGGEGTLAVIASSVPGAMTHEVPGCTGPDGRAVVGQWLELPGRHAVVELAQVSGFALMASPDPLGASTRGLGEVIAAALDAGALSLTIALGGSASTDGGAGALSALGLTLRDASGAALPDGGGALTSLAAADLSALRDPPPGGVTLLTDVDHPLLGECGAAQVFAPQKGARPDDVAQLEAGLARLVEVMGQARPTGPSVLRRDKVDDATGEKVGAAQLPGTGAAGGAAYGFVQAWGATVTPGAAHVATLVGLPELAASADVLITGEGRFDETSLHGKAVGEALRLATAGLAPPAAAVVAGSIPDPRWLTEHGVWHCSLVDLGGEVGALADPERWLVESGVLAARALGAWARPTLG